MPRPRKLEIAERPLVQSDLQQISTMKWLNGLNLQRTNITDDGIRYVFGLENLTDLTLTDTAISDGGLAQLTKLELLRNLRIARTQVTEKGVRRLAASLPLLEVDAAIESARRKE